MFGYNDSSLFLRKMLKSYCSFLPLQWIYGPVFSVSFPFPIFFSSFYAAACMQGQPVIILSLVGWVAKVDIMVCLNL